jgi:hypothetical protein
MAVRILPQIGGQVDELATSLTGGLDEVHQWLIESLGVCLDPWSWHQHLPPRS